MCNLDNFYDSFSFYVDLQEIKYFSHLLIVFEML